MSISFYNSLTHQHDTFKPIEDKTVRMYSCGPTVYDFAHIGNFRSFLFADLIRRFLELMGNDVIHVMNITDVGHMTEDAVADGAGEDKMGVAAKRIKEDKKSGKVPDGAIENPDDPYQIAQYYTDAFLEDARKLGMKVAFEYPDRILHATDNIDVMQEMIGELISKNHAYIGEDGVVYYSVESFKDYGKLSGNTLDQLREGSGGRVQEEHQSNKRHPADFMLWKPDSTHIMKWDSPWGTGYPGWHIECSAMARKRLERDVIDIHTGGEDLIFPHHECEIAQSCGSTGEDSFAKFWMHARFLLVEGEKMSKSKGNFYTVRDVLEGRVTGRDVHPAVLRFELLKSHYRSNMNFTIKGLQDSANSVRKIVEFRNGLLEQTKEVADVPLSNSILRAFTDALSDDLNMSEALGVVFPWIGEKPDDPSEALGILAKINHVLSIAPIEGEDAAGSSGGDDLAEVEGWCKEMDNARSEKNWALADELRDKIKDAGYEVRQTPDGTKVQKELA